MTMNQDPSLVNAKVGDFGLSISARNTCAEILPTWQWLAPEVFGNGEYNYKSDIYSYGIVVYEIFARILPYTDMTEYISIKEFALSAEDMANQAKISLLIDTGYTIKGNKGMQRHFISFR
jgi:serine/threonine protein kinase